jgi:hypothetical protein
MTRRGRNWRRSALAASVAAAAALAFAASGEARHQTRSARFAFPTATVAVGNRLLVLNSQLDKLGTKNPPSLPFTVVSIPRP